MEGAGPYTMHLHTAAWPTAYPNARWERERNSQPLPGGSRKGFFFVFVFVSVAICVNTSLFWKKNNVKMFCINSELFSCCFFLRKNEN